MLYQTKVDFSGLKVNDGDPIMAQWPWYLQVLNKSCISFQERSFPGTLS